LVVNDLLNSIKTCSGPASKKNAPKQLKRPSFRLSKEWADFLAGQRGWVWGGKLPSTAKAQAARVVIVKNLGFKGGDFSPSILNLHPV
jgi:hypothetical protein